MHIGYFTQTVFTNPLYLNMARIAFCGIGTAGVTIVSLLASPQVLKGEYEIGLFVTVMSYVYFWPLYLIDAVMKVVHDKCSIDSSGNKKYVHRSRISTYSGDAVNNPQSTFFWVSNNNSRAIKQVKFAPSTIR